jgi:hypothetical protein
MRQYNCRTNSERTVLLCESSETLPELRWRPGSNRIWRNRQVIDVAGLKVFLLHAQPPSPHEGTQLSAECPRGRTGSRQPHAARVRPYITQSTDGTDHQTSARLLELQRRAAILELALDFASFPRYFNMPNHRVKSTSDLRKSRKKGAIFSTPRGAIRKREKASATGRVKRKCIAAAQFVGCVKRTSGLWCVSRTLQNHSTARSIHAPPRPGR